MVNKTHQRQVEQRRAARRAARQAERERQRRRLMITITAVVSVLVVVVGVFLIAGIGGGDDTPAAGDTPSATPSSTGPASAENRATSISDKLAAAPKRPTALAAEVDCTYVKSAEAASKAVKAPANGKTSARGTTPVTLATSIGDLKLTLDKSLAPCAVKNFLSLAGQKFFDGTSCHRMTVGKGLQVLQCGDPSGTGSGGPGYSFKDEVFDQLKYGRGILAMANSGPDTNGSQFFIVYGDGSGLEPKYSAFGTVDAASLKKIDAVALKGVTPANGPGDGQPITPVNITSATAAS